MTFDAESSSEIVIRAVIAVGHLINGTDQINKAKGYVPILAIDSARNNFVDDEDMKSKLLQMVANALPQEK